MTSPDGQHRYQSPPNWPPPPSPAWTPPPGWQPDPSWPPAPEGWQFWVPVAPPQQGWPTVPVPGGSTPPGKPWVVRHKRLLGALAGVVVILWIIGALIPDSGSTRNTANDGGLASASPSPSPTVHATVDPARYVASVVCASVAHVIGAEGTLAVANRTRWAKAKDPYAAAAYLKTHTLLADPSETSKFEGKIDHVLASSLRAATAAGYTGGSYNFRTAALTRCKVAPQFSTVESREDAAQSAKTTLIDAAGSVPWYPKGYFEAADGVAMKWIRGGCSGYFSCFRAHVIVRDGCDNLYVELSLIDHAGNKVGYTNDVLVGLGPGDSGIMEFTSTEESASSAEVSEANCY